MLDLQTIDRKKLLLFLLEMLIMAAKVVGIILLCLFEMLCFVLIFLEFDEDYESDDFGAHYNVWSGDIDPVKHYDGIYFDN